MAQKKAEMLQDSSIGSALEFHVQPIKCNEIPAVQPGAKLSPLIDINRNPSRHSLLYPSNHVHCRIISFVKKSAQTASCWHVQSCAPRVRLVMPAALFGGEQ